MSIVTKISDFTSLIYLTFNVHVEMEVMFAGRSYHLAFHVYLTEGGRATWFIPRSLAYRAALSGHFVLMKYFFLFFFSFLAVHVFFIACFLLSSSATFPLIFSHLQFFLSLKDIYYEIELLTIAVAIQ